VPDEPQNDTVAQKPYEVGRGAPPSPPVPDADRDQENPFVVVSVAKARNGGLQTADGGL
jgi:hypothetical protein